MSVLIKGLKMPKGDKALVVCINSNGTIDRPNWQWDYTRIKGAEAIELPDHGRLIDAEKLKAVKFHPLPYTHITPTDCDAESYKRGWNDAIDAVAENEPTFIEADRSE